MYLHFIRTINTKNKNQYSSIAFAFLHYRMKERIITKHYVLMELIKVKPLWCNHPSRTPISNSHISYKIYQSIWNARIYTNCCVTCSCTMQTSGTILESFNRQPPHTLICQRFVYLSNVIARLCFVNIKGLNVHIY